MGAAAGQGDGGTGAPWALGSAETTDSAGMAPDLTGPPGQPSTSARCRLFGHRYVFWAHGRLLAWECERSCGARGCKSYPSADAARRYARSFDRRDTDDLGRRAPLFALFPLRLWRWAASRGRRRDRCAADRGTVQASRGIEPQPAEARTQARPSGRR